MANEISIRLSSFSDFTAVNVEGLGVIKVKKESSNQGLRRSEIMNGIFELQAEAKNLEKRMKKLSAEGKKEGDPEVDKLESRASEKIARMTDLQQTYQKLSRSRLFDDEDGKLVDKLYELATDEDIAKVLATADKKKDDDES